MLSIVIPTFRRPRLLNRLLGELLKQAATFGDDVEIIVVDNSPERSAEPIVEALGEAVRYVPEARGGVARARNAGVAASNGRYVIFVDDDQLPVPGWLVAFRGM